MEELLLLLLLLLPLLREGARSWSCRVEGCCGEFQCGCRVLVPCRGREQWA